MQHRIPTPPPLYKVIQLHPDDAHNRRLIENVHPESWENPTPTPRYNLVVVGAGTAGLVSAAGAAGLGAKVAIVERHLFGGDCLNTGCVPSKAMIRAARAVADIREAATFGISVIGNVEVDFAAVMERVRGVRADISAHDATARFRDHYGIDVFLGDGRFTGADQLDVSGASLRFERAVIATGARAVTPDIPGLAEAGFDTNETIFQKTALPKRLAVLGGGPIGSELAQAFARLGSSVTMLERGGQFLSREDADAAAIVYAQFQRDGVDVRFHTSVTRVEQRGGHKILHLETSGTSTTIEVDAILVGIGRAPNVEGLGLEAAGVRANRDGIVVDDFLRTSNPHIYAAGDVASKYKFTHAADAMARIVIQNALLPYAGRKRVSSLTIPWTTYTDPEIAHVGLYERDASDRGISLDTYTVPLADVDRAITDGEAQGFAKVHVRSGSDTILGATIVARHAGDMIGELTSAMVHGIGLGKLAAVIHPYPTQAEVVRKVADAYQRTKLTPKRAALLRRLFAWKRG